MKKIISVDVWDSPEKKLEFYNRVINSQDEDVIFFAYHEPTYDDISLPKIHEILDFLSKQNRKLKVVLGCYQHDVHFKHPNLEVYTWVDFFLRKTFFHSLHVSRCRETNYGELNYYKQALNPTSFDHYFVSLNRRSHRHRCHLIDLMAKNNLIEGNAIGWHNMIGFGSVSDTYPWQYFKPQVLSLSDTTDFDRHGMLVPNEYFKAFGQIVCESTDEVIFITEKTGISLVCHKPFLIAGPVGIHEKLKSMNFEPYDEIFNYDFDMEPNEEKRYQLVLDNFIRLQNEYSKDDLVDLYKKLLPKLKHNFENLKKVVFDMSDLPLPVSDVYNIYKSTGIKCDHWTAEILSFLEDTKHLVK